MKTIYYLLLGLCLAMAACKPEEPELPATGQEEEEAINAPTNGTCGDNLTWNYDKAMATLIIAGTGEMENHSQGYPWEPYQEKIKTIIIKDGVTSIGYWAFANCTTLTQVNIPGSVTSIGYNAFNGCEALTQVTIPDGVTRIEDGIFYHCSKLTEITLPDGVTSIGYGAFEDCDGLATITIPNSVTSIGSYAFAHCDGLKQITLPDKLASIEEYTFYNCDLLAEITIPNSVESIGNWAFHSCYNLTKITIGNGVTSIRESVFDDTDLYNNAANWTNNVLYIDNCLIAAKTELSGNYEIAAGTRVIAGSAFNGCDALTQITIPNSVTSIGNMAFYYCSALTQVNIPDGVESIGYYTFYQCSALAQVTIGKGVESIGEYAFYNCSALAEMTVLATVPPTVIYNAFYEVSRDIPVYVPAESLEAYKAAEAWKEFTNLQAIQ